MDKDNKYDQTFRNSELGVNKDNKSFDPKLEADEAEERSFKLQEQQHEQSE